MTDEGEAVFAGENSRPHTSEVCKAPQVLSEAPLLSNGVGEPQWFALYTCANQEKRVAAQLEARGVEHFLPLYRSRRNWKDRRVFLDLPLFPGYVFARFEWLERVRVLQARGMVRIVGANGRPCPLPEKDIEVLRIGIVGALRFEPHPYLAAGARVRILQGPLAGMTGILVRKKNSCRVVLSVDLIARSVAVEVDAAGIERIA